MKRHVFEKYYSRHSHYPRVRIPNGAQRLTVEFTRGYVRIKTSPPFAGEVYITRSAWIQLLKQALPITRLWAQHPALDFDVPQAVHQAYLEEQALDRELRDAKKTRYLSEPLRGNRGDPAGQSAAKAERQRRRYLAAKRRARLRRQQ